jgi:ribosome-binding protein aMBF1 (putative translation factor)
VERMNKIRRFVCGICGSIKYGKGIEIEEEGVKKEICEDCYNECVYEV